LFVLFQQQDRVLTTDEKLQHMMQEALLLRLSLVSCRLLRRFV